MVPPPVEKRSVNREYSPDNGVRARRRVPHPAVALAIVLAAALPAGAAMPGVGLLGSKHDLSAKGPGPVRAESETEVCVFCHTPHKALDEGPLWNHALSTAVYTPYGSSTAKAAVGQPTGSSRLCLSCHDGTVALGRVASRRKDIAMANGVADRLQGRANLGSDLSDDHPVSFTYDHSLTAAKGELHSVETLDRRVRMDSEGRMQCTACHDPHNNQFGNFLTMDNRESALCTTCHDTRYWIDSTHRASRAAWNGAGLDPWPQSSQNSVSANGCGNCHSVHGAGSGPRLMTFADEEQVCAVCHGGNVAQKNIQSEFAKRSVHPVASTAGVHDPTEGAIPASRHVSCVDCHNPHASKRISAAAMPSVSGALAGVAGVNAAGAAVEQISREHELCFRCHSDGGGGSMESITRKVETPNMRRLFDVGNASYHPVIGVRKNPNVPSLIAPRWTTASLMNCTDCHNNDQAPAAGGTGPNGPHGSAFAPLLERNLERSDFGQESAGAYALCYKCHSRDSILADESFKGHRLHVVDAQTACTTCHDPHGVVSAKQLINFNTRYVSPSSRGELNFVDKGPFRGSCSLTCHGRDHDALPYAP